jgi:predicted enzyme related to lactoylglutathione lyase
MDSIARMRIRNVVIDANDVQALAPFWEAATGYSRVFREEYFIVLASDDPGQPNLLLQRVPEPKVGKNRCHVDLQAEGDIEDVLERLVDLGATRGQTFTIGVTWTVLTDPAGNEFCVTHPAPQSGSSI